MYKKQILLAMLILGITVQLGFADSVKFKSNSTDKDKKPLILTGLLEKPEGDGPFSTVIMMHSCRGDSIFLTHWAQRLVTWGYVVFRVDSMKPRHRRHLCGDSNMQKSRAQDAYDAKLYLMTLPFVKKDKIAVVGWSQGASSTLFVIDDAFEIKNRGGAFQAAIAFYPECDDPIGKQNAPLLVLSGDKDTVNPTDSCYQTFQPEKAPHEIKIKIYANATHGFDWENINTNWRKHKLEYNAEAAEDALIQVKSFLAKYLD